MPSGSAVAALVAAVRKHRLLTSERAQRLMARLHERPVADPEDLRAALPDCGLGGDELSAILGLLPGVSMPDYRPWRPLAHLADGGMGSIWLADGPASGLVVLKTLRADLVQAVSDEGQPARVEGDGSVWLDPDPAALPAPAAVADPSPAHDLRRRLERETAITRQLDHPHVVRCLDQGVTTDGQPFLVLEYVPSGDLREFVEEHGPLSESLALSIVDQVAAGLESAHHLGLIHRDIKPANIFLEADGRAKLADFGFARATAPNRTQLTMAGTVLGSPLFMAPEQVEARREVDIRCDLYALGGVLFWCLAGRPPFEGRVQEVMRAHCTQPPPPLASRAPGASQASAAIVARCLQKRPEERFGDPASLRQALQSAMAAFGRRPGELVPLPRGSSRQPAVAAAPALPSATADPPAVPAPVGSPTPAPPSLGLQGPLASDWIALVPRSARDETLVVVYARPRLVLGKLRDPSVDLCLRNYPEAVHREACQKISRSHCAIAADLRSGTVAVQDLGSANGTVLDGESLVGGRPVPLGTESEHILEVARTVTLRLRLLPRRSVSPAGAGEGIGLGAASPNDALLITRPKNRNALAYVLCLRRFSLGGPGADLVLPGASTRGRIEIGLQDGAWVVSCGPGAPWEGLVPDRDLDCGGVLLRPRPATGDDL